MSSDSSGSSWSIASSSFPDPKEKACRLENKTESLSCEEIEGNKSTSLHDIRIHHHAFCFPGGIIRHLSNFPAPHPRRGKTPDSKAPGGGDRHLFLRTARKYTYTSWNMYKKVYTRTSLLLHTNFKTAKSKADKAASHMNKLNLAPFLLY
jgi:hypothetical protein